MTKRSATLIGMTAILMWSLLALLTVASGTVPPFQLAAMTFAIGACVGARSWIVRPGGWRALRQPLVAWLVGVGGLFGYHALYFISLRFAPPAEAGLVNYLWPLLIVLFSALLPGERLAAHHVIGALLGLAGTIVLFAGRGLSGSLLTYLPGLSAAFAAAFLWGAYSVLSRRLAAVPTDAVAGFCAATSLLAAICHRLLEQTVWPQTLRAMVRRDRARHQAGWRRVLYLGYRDEARRYPRRRPPRTRRRCCRPACSFWPAMPRWRQRLLSPRS